ncbi:hypothetical protein [Dactylosporangium sp. CA-092794]|uniref:hypothetical protein n=1 Tax=Dactylosporangium sp. CA-092794 TaxID=3239929 RepID=UPI003D8C5B90
MIRRLVILGGSSSLGLGVRGRSYAVRVGELIGVDVEVLQLSRSAQTIADVEPAMVEQIRRFRPDLVILSFGAAEAHVHPSRWLQAVLDRFAPRSWRGPAGMEPRPYFSSRRYRALRQRIVSAAKIRLKRIIVGLTGGFHRLSSEEFDRCLRELLDRLGPVPKVLVGLWSIDDYMFPRSNPVLSRNDTLLQLIARDREDVIFVPTRDAVEYWSHFLLDHAHLNDRGHDVVARLIMTGIEPALTHQKADTGAHHPS